MIGICALSVLALFGSSSIVEPQAQPQAGGSDMSAYFATLRDCGSCTEAGYGWCPLRRMCGGFANKECGIGEEYVAKGASAAKPTSAAKPKKAKESKKPAKTNDMSAVFAKLRDCGSCTEAGYGWCTIQRKCGGFANKECGIGERYISADPPPRNGIWESKKPKKAATEKKAEATKEKAAPSSKPKAKPKPAAPAGNDMSAYFATLRDCGSCTEAGYGWCTIQRKCGGFANKECGIGERYVAKGAAPSMSQPTAAVPAASPPPPASLLHAGPVSPPTPDYLAAKAKEEEAAATEAVAVDATGAAKEAPAAAAALLDAADAENATGSHGYTGGLPGVAALGYDELQRLPHETLVQRVLELQATVDSMRA